MWIDHSVEPTETPNKREESNMATVAKAGNSGSVRQLVPAGTHVGRCIGVVDLGTQQTTNMQGKVVPQHKVRVTWELPEELREFDGEQRPFVVSKEYTLSLHEKATLRKELEAWRGRQFTKEELDGFEVAKLVGVAAMVSVGHVDRKDGQGQFAKVLSVTKPPKSVTCPPQVNESVLYAVEDGRNEVFTSFPDWLQEKIGKCEEFKPVEDTAGEELGEEEDEEAPF